MKTKEYIRYAISNGRYVKEVTTFISDYEDQDPTDTRLVELEGEVGKWFWLGSSNFLADSASISSLNNGQAVNPLLAPLKPGVTLIAESEFTAEIARQENFKDSAIAATVIQKQQKIGAKEVILKRLGVTDEELELFK